MFYAWLSPYFVVAAVLSSVCCVLFFISHYFDVVTVLQSQRSIENNLGVRLACTLTYPYSTCGIYTGYDVVGAESVPRLFFGAISKLVSVWFPLTRIIFLATYFIVSYTSHKLCRTYISRTFG